MSASDSLPIWDQNPDNDPCLNSRILRFIDYHIGEDKTAEFLSIFGGQKVSIPDRGMSFAKSCFADDIERFGADFFEALAEEFGGSFMTLPVGKSYRARLLKRHGQTINQIASALGVTYQGAEFLLRKSEKPAHVV
ncbi:hypothetical protein AA0242T_2704 [Acetobacter aceti NRIC 0242]|uniref:Transcriptional regulator n=1 Tax=Acetobacter aceti NBRC 14818 TaxID=887700 RepID=A0AB33IIT0_ACEAC|nr:hypothetical protein [Acetobacter aceti]TCS27246.1 hypothetical protein EDC15_1278 [Acetobacter aceti NBRC 14818]BCK77767.1 hypothetical protein EMQ_P211 [Acetobacter aceti NBRC 14818]GBO82002.1 hypothetical protein AA0242T_2704 [Acetobacter aceti NRIC 0242]